MKLCLKEKNCLGCEYSAVYKDQLVCWMWSTLDASLLLVIDPDRPSICGQYIGKTRNCVVCEDEDCEIAQINMVLRKKRGDGF